MKIAKIHCLFIACALLCVITLDIGILFFVDPYHIFHETRWNKNQWCGDQVLVNEGQINTFLKKTNDYDTVLISSSHGKEFKGKDITKAVCGKGTIKLYLSGMFWSEMNQFFLKSLATKKIKNVVFVIDSFSKKQSRLTENFYKQLWLSSIVWFYRNLRGSYKATTYQNTNTMHCCYCEEFFTKSLLFQYWLKNPEISHYHSILPYKNDFEDMDKYIIQPTKNHPEIQFYFVLHSENFITLLDPRLFHRIFNNQRYLIEQCASLPNVKIYGFQNHPFVKNLANYYDKHHFYYGINKFVAYCMQQDWYRITPENFPAYEKQMFENANSFQIAEDYPHRDTFEELVAAEWAKRGKKQPKKIFK